ncbi:MAG TPA: 50S ribosomal protein L30 [Trueperaceae bacterium]
MTLTRSQIGVPKDQRATLRGLGLKKIGDTREVADTPDVQGMVRKVAYLLTIEASTVEGQGK